MGFKKKLHTCYPGKVADRVETHRTKEKVRFENSDPQSIERNVRQLLSNKISGTQVGIWLLVPEYLRLGTWELLRSWTGVSDHRVESRLALQLVNEAALCVTGIREKRALSQKGFELANGLPFVATDTAIHHVLDSHTVAEAQRLQVALGKIRQTFGHFNGRLLAIDPHRIKSYTKRQMVRRKKDPNDAKPWKMAQTFFCLDADTKQPVCFTSGTSAKTVTQATLELLGLAADILPVNKSKPPLVMADNEHYTVELLDWVLSHSPYDMLVPMQNNKSVSASIEQVSQDFKRHWAGYATAKNRYKMTRSDCDPYYQFIQRKGERQDDFDFKAFLCTSDRDELEALTRDYPDRWHIEEFFKNDQALGWDKAGTMNLNIRYGKMTMALLAQAAISMMRQRAGEPVLHWDAGHIAKDFFRGLEGDIRVKRDTIVVTYYNAPNLDLMKEQYENLPEKLAQEGVSNTIPWLYNFKLDFQFK